MDLTPQQMAVFRLNPKVFTTLGSFQLRGDYSVASTSNGESHNKVLKNCLEILDRGSLRAAGMSWKTTELIQLWNPQQSILMCGLYICRVGCNEAP